MSHELVAFQNGTYSVKPLLAAEAMHSHIGPWQEARQVYVDPSGLAERLGQPGPPLVLFDLGMGIAANALAALECAVGAGSPREFQILSFEKHLDGLRLALQHAEHFPWLARHRGTLENLLKHRETSLDLGKSRIRWRLFEGDFLELALEALPPADLVFFDFYSPKNCPELWDVACFEKIRAASSPEVRLLTYGASTAARSAMLLAGFSVGMGCPTAAKSETTVATLRAAALKSPLGGAWLRKLARSEKPLPPGIGPARRAAALARLRAHPQFARDETGGHP